MRSLPVFVFFAATLVVPAVAIAAHGRHSSAHGRHTPGASSPRAPALTADSINAAAPDAKSNTPALIVKAEVLLDRDDFSPGVIDGTNGDNFHKAVTAFQQANNLTALGRSTVTLGTP